MRVPLRNVAAHEHVVKMLRALVRQKSSEVVKVGLVVALAVVHLHDEEAPVARLNAVRPRVVRQAHHVHVIVNWRGVDMLELAHLLLARDDALELVVGPMRPSVVANSSFKFAKCEKFVRPVARKRRHS